MADTTTIAPTDQSNVMGSLATLLAGINYAGNTSAANADRQALLASIADASNKFAALTPPNLQALIGPYQQALFLGKITPQEYTAQVQQASAAANIQVDPALLQQQSDTLAQLKNIADQGGLTATDKAQLNDIATKQGTIARGAREAATNSLASRGLAGSGAELLARSVADQGNVSASSKAGTDVAANAQQRALAALTQSGQLATQMQTNSFNQQKSQADAQNAINQFNAQLKSNQNAVNTAAANTAAQNAQNAQYNVQGTNIAQSNLANSQRLTAAQQSFQDQLQTATGGANVALNAAKNYADLGKADTLAASANAAGLAKGLADPATLAGATTAVNGVKNLFSGTPTPDLTNTGGVSTIPDTPIDPSTLADPNTFLGDIPEFATGTPYVLKPGLAIIHQGERIVPAHENKLKPEEVKSIIDSLIPTKYQQRSGNPQAMALAHLAAPTR